MTSGTKTSPTAPGQVPDASARAHAIAALHQLERLMQRIMNTPPVSHGEGVGFSLSAPDPPGPRLGSIDVRLDHDVIRIRLEVLRTDRAPTVVVEELFRRLAPLGQRFQVVEPKTPDPGEATSLFLELLVEPRPMGSTRERAFVTQVEHVARVAELLHGSPQDGVGHAALVSLFEKCSKFLAPVHPIPHQQLAAAPDLAPWALTVTDHLSARYSVALPASQRILEDIALAALAHAMNERMGVPLAVFLKPHIDAASLVELARQAPGDSLVAVAAFKLRLGSNPYETGGEMPAMVETLTSMGRPGVFTGTFDELRQVFHGGQGCRADPLAPAVLPVPDVPLSALVRFAVRQVGLQRGGLTAGDEAQLSGLVEQILDRVEPAARIALVSPVAARVFTAWRRTSCVTIEEQVRIARRDSARTETLGGLGERRVGQRSPGVQEKLVRGLTGTSLETFLKSHLTGQDAAIESLVKHLRTECLTRPAHQPIRAGLVGTSGTGKSKTTELLAEHLRMALMRVDLASMTEAHTFSSQMLGSGRGIVGSYQAGRLESAAKDHRGVVLELSDIDHVTNPTVRTAIADLFLDLMDTGEAQSAKGSRFPCANMILIFTANYGRADDEMTRSIGYAPLDHDDLTARGKRELNAMFSSAFLDRLGAPIFYHPLPENSWAIIAERAVADAIRRAAACLSWSIPSVSISPDLGTQVVAWMGAERRLIGARTVQEHARALAADAFDRYASAQPQGGTVHISPTANRSLTMTLKPQEL